MLDSSPPRIQRKPREPDSSPKPTDLAEKMIALQRKRAAASRPKDRAERSAHAAAALAARQPASPRRHPAPAAPTLIVTNPDADPEEFSRCLTISQSPRSQQAHAHSHSKGQSKLFNPEVDPVPMRRTAEPETISDSNSSSYAPRVAPKQTNTQPREAAHPQRQLFDPRRDDPVRFNGQPRKPPPTPKSSGDYVSVSSVSSYAASVSSSNFTLSSSTTDGSNPSVFDRTKRPESKTNAFSSQLKKLYRDISALETKILKEDEDNTEEGRIVLRGTAEAASDDAEKLKWRKMIEDHKQLVEMMHNLLEMSLAPGVPASLRNIPAKYNITIRLWTHGFHCILENLRRSSLSSKIALEHLQDFIYYAYTFYTGLLEEQTLVDLKQSWLEALGDLARYRMAVAAMIPAPAYPRHPLTAAAVLSTPHHSTPTSTAANASAAISTVSERPAARIDDSPSPSVGIVAARNLELEPEKERWRKIARDWFAAGVVDKPGNGKLHHHLGLLSREAEGEELRAVYHYMKSLIVTVPFTTSRESVLPIWSPAAQARRLAPDSRAPDLFVLLHGMLYTNIQLDDFDAILARLLERLGIEDPEAREWTMMAVVNIAALLDYGRPQGVLRRAGVGGGEKGDREHASGAAKVKLAKKGGSGDEGNMDVDAEQQRRSMENGASPRMPPAGASPALSEASAPEEHPPAFRMAQQLAFTMLAHVLARPERRVGAHGPVALNPYLTVLLTFLATVLKVPGALSALERAVPWAALARFLQDPKARVPLVDSASLSPALVLPEDWCMRGMDWGGRRLFERGFWKSGEERKMELELLDEVEGDSLEEFGEDGRIEDDDEAAPRAKMLSVAERRWRRAVWAGVRLAKLQPGFRWEEGPRETRWWIEDPLAEKVRVWEDEDRAEREAEEMRKRGTRWGDDSMDIDEDGMEDDEEPSEDDEDDSDEVKALKARRRYLRSLLQSSQRSSLPTPPPTYLQPAHKRQRSHATRKPGPMSSLRLAPGYTILVMDTNILLSSLSLVISLIESLRWTIVVPLPVIMELDGLASKPTLLGDAAKSAVDYLIAHVRSHAASLKVQTSRGNYLSSLTVRREQVDFDDPDAWERNMDDLILKAAIWQDEHWVDRSAFLNAGGERDTAGAAKVVLLSLDRNLRLKARSRQLDAATERDIALLLAAAS